jgi:hypothetical protein
MLHFHGNPWSAVKTFSLQYLKHIYVYNSKIFHIVNIPRMYIQSYAGQSGHKLSVVQDVLVMSHSLWIHSVIPVMKILQITKGKWCQVDYKENKRPGDHIAYMSYIDLIFPHINKIKIIFLYCGPIRSGIITLIA